MGADLVVDPRQESPYRLVDIARRDETVVFECVGVPGMIDDIFLNVPHRARIVVVGVCLQMDRSRPLIAVNKELNVQYVLGYSVREFHDTLQRIADGDPMTSNRSSPIPSAWTALPVRSRNWRGPMRTARWSSGPGVDPPRPSAGHPWSAVPTAEVRCGNQPPAAVQCTSVWGGSSSAWCSNTASTGVPILTSCSGSPSRLPIMRTPS